jgi:S-adenosylmethionine synthetase
VATAQIVLKSDVNHGVMEKKVGRIIDDLFSNIAEITEMAIRGELRTF